LIFQVEINRASYPAQNGAGSLPVFKFDHKSGEDELEQRGMSDNYFYFQHFCASVLIMMTITTILLTNQRIVLLQFLYTG
jgi:hypothetical protein